MTLGNACPGSSRFKSPTVEYVACPECDAEVEIWSIDLEAECHVCKTTITRAQPPSCIEWCSFAKKCIDEGKLAQFASSRKTEEK